MKRALVAFVFMLAAMFAVSLAFSPYEVVPFATVRADWRSSDAWLLDRQGEPLSRVRIDLSTEVMPLLLRRIFCYKNDKLHRDIGTLESLIAAQFELPLLVPEQMNEWPAPSEVWINQLRSGNPSLANRIVDSLGSVRKANCVEKED